MFNNTRILNSYYEIGVLVAILTLIPENMQLYSLKIIQKIKKNIYVSYNRNSSKFHQLTNNKFLFCKITNKSTITINL